MKSFWIKIAGGVILLLGFAFAGVFTATSGLTNIQLGPVYAKNKTTNQGRKAFQQAGCTSCHQVMGQGGNGVDLTYIGRVKGVDEELIKLIVRNPEKGIKEFYRRQGKAGQEPKFTLMPPYHKQSKGMVGSRLDKELTDQELDAIAKWLVTLK